MVEKDLVLEGTENTETTSAEKTVGEQVEEIPAEKTFTQSEMEEIVKKRLARNTAKIKRDHERERSEMEDLVEVLKTGTGKESVKEIKDSLSQFYQSKGVKFPEKSPYSEKDLEILGKFEAEEIIADGDEAVGEELNRLTLLGTKNMTVREKASYKVLADHAKDSNRRIELEKIGVFADVYNSKEFREFERKFNSDTPIVDIYNIYSKTKPQKEIQTMGSMKSTAEADNGVKDFYSYDEAKKFTKKDFDNNPALYEAVKKSMTKW